MDRDFTDDELGQIFTLARKLANSALPEFVDPDDFAQEVSIKCWDSHNQLRNEKSPDGWVYRIAKNKITHIYRNRKSQKYIHVEITTIVELEDQEALYPIERIELDIFLQQVLSADEYIVFYLWLFGHMTQKEISVYLHVPHGTVKTWIKSARQKLRSFFHYRGSDRNTSDRKSNQVTPI